MLSNAAIVLAAIVLAMVGAGLVTVLLVYFGGTGNTNQHEAQLDAIKTAGTVVVGTGGAFALWLTARRQRTSEIAVNQKADDQAAVDRAFNLQQAQADAARADAEARRITEQYGRAVDQLGSEKAAVRLGGLYALERLAQDNPGQRPTIVAVICAYLRMPYRPPGEQPGTDAEPAERDEFEASSQEREVRVTGQRILADHLRPGKDPDHPSPTFWPGTTLNFTGATLIDLNLSDCLFTAVFGEVTFIGNTLFSYATFTGGSAVFNEATFTGRAGFFHATFHGEPQFDNATFNGDAIFKNATCNDVVDFESATFNGEASFDEVKFTESVWFFNATFNGDTTFDTTTFSCDVAFTKATFNDPPSFAYTTFNGCAQFEEAAFNSIARFSTEEWSSEESSNNGTSVVASAWFDTAIFNGQAGFKTASFKGDTWFGEGWVNMGYTGSRSWPPGWTVLPASSPARPDGVAEGEWGRLVRETASAPPGHDEDQHGS